MNHNHKLMNLAETSTKILRLCMLLLVVGMSAAFEGVTPAAMVQGYLGPTGTATIDPYMQAPMIEVSMTDKKPIKICVPEC